MTFLAFKLILYGSFGLTLLLFFLRGRFTIKSFWVWLPVLVMMAIFSGYWINWMWQIEHAGEIFNKAFPP